MPRGRKKKIVELEQNNSQKLEDKNEFVDKKLNIVLKKLNEKFPGKVKRANAEDLTITKLDTGIKSLNEAMGGGLPVGFITEIYGDESGGKSTIVAKMIREAQLRGEVCAYLDAEHALDQSWLNKLGVNIGEMIHTEISDADNVFDVIKALVQSKGVKIVVVDSVAALTPRKEVEDDMDKQSMGTLARTVNKGLRVSNTVNTRQGTAIIFINQTRDKIGIVYGSPITTPGGKGMKFFAGIRIEVKRGEWWPDSKNRKGFECVCKLVKNKTSIPYTEARFVLMNETGEIKEWDEVKK